MHYCQLTFEWEQSHQWRTRYCPWAWNNLLLLGETLGYHRIGRASRCSALNVKKVDYNHSIYAGDHSVASGDNEDAFFLFASSKLCAETRISLVGRNIVVIRYKVIEILAGGGCALVEWRLETGRTHQIRAHAKYLGIPLLGDDVYGGTKSMCLSLLQSKNPSSYHGQFLELIDRLERPCLHALTLGFKHPKTGENVRFSQIPPTDFADILLRLRNIGTQKVS